VVTNDYLLLDGAGWPGFTGDRIICPFGNDYVYGAFCNRIETGSNMNLKVANLNTDMGDRFIMKAADSGVQVFNNVGVTSYTSDLPSKGSVSAFIRGSIKEGGRLRDTPTDDGVEGPVSLWSLYETVMFSDSTAVSGDISTFAKAMNYNSVLDPSGDIPYLIGELPDLPPPTNE
jgi:hypothetical protein